MDEGEIADERPCVLLPREKTFPAAPAAVVDLQRFMQPFIVIPGVDALPLHRQVHPP